MLSTAGGRVARKPPPVMVTTATSGDGVAALADAIEKHREAAREPIAARDRAAHQVRRGLADLAWRRVASHSTFDGMIDNVAARAVDPLTAAETLLDDVYDMRHAAKVATAAERIEQAIHGGKALDVFEAAAVLIEREDEAGDWYWPQTLMEDLFHSNELGSLLPAIEERARASRGFRRQLVFTARSVDGGAGDAAERFLALGRSFESEFRDELDV
jgi:hypothetical protein